MHNGGSSSTTATTVDAKRVPSICGRRCLRLTVSQLFICHYNLTRAVA